MDFMEPNGTIGQWKAPDGTDILFPETELWLGDELKLRGGAPVCVPNFGDAPTTGPYAGIRSLEKHGLVRRCSTHNGEPVAENTAFSQSGPTKIDGWTSTVFYFDAPWRHEVRVSVRTTGARKGARRQQMQHSIYLCNKMSDGIEMPYSIGFHPYFATAGDAFSLHYGDKDWSVYDLTVNEPFFVRHRHGERFVIVTSHGTTEIELKGGYNGYFVWTDKPDAFICVEPVCVGSTKRYQMLGPDPVKCKCEMTYLPKN